MSQYQIEHDGTGYRIYETNTGLDKRLIGPRWASPRQANRYADLQAQLDRVSPLRPTTRRTDELGSFPPLPSEEVRLSLGSPDVSEPPATGG